MIAPLALAARAAAWRSARPCSRSLLERDAARPTLVVTASEPLPAPPGARGRETLTLTLGRGPRPGRRGAARPAAAEGAASRPARRPPGAGADGRSVRCPTQIEPTGRVCASCSALRPRPPTDVAALWVTLFPPSPSRSHWRRARRRPTGGPMPDRTAASTRESGRHRSGRVRLRPALEALYVSAESTFESPQPVRRRLLRAAAAPRGARRRWAGERWGPTTRRAGAAGRSSRRSRRRATS